MKFPRIGTVKTRRTRIADLERRVRRIELRLDALSVVPHALSHPAGPLSPEQVSKFRSAWSDVVNDELLRAQP